jgi:glutamate N-acetyltransferase/amino-acid N-acetyltransferase
LASSLRQAVDSSFNLVSVDGDTSTNDTVLLLANGMANNELITAGSALAEQFQAALNQLCIFLAREMARDGEGATKLIEVVVRGAKTVADARKAARTVVSSPLVKTAVYGNDPNWGRVVAAVGRSGVEVVESKIDLYLGGMCLLKAGRPQQFDHDEAVELLKEKKVYVTVDLGLGDGVATAWGCDLTEEYVKINSHYTT